MIKKGFILSSQSDWDLNTHHFNTGLIQCPSQVGAAIYLADRTVIQTGIAAVTCYHVSCCGTISGNLHGDTVVVRYWVPRVES